MLVDLLFGRKSPEGEHGALLSAGPGYRGNATESHTHYSPGLMVDLKAEHQLLLEAFAQIGRARDAGDLAGASSRLEDFRRLLQAHFLKENGRLYFYLERSLHGDSATRALVRDFHAEMEEIGQALLQFIENYRSLAHNATLADSFAEDLESIGKSLRERIHREESILYPMYLPSY